MQTQRVSKLAYCLGTVLVIDRDHDDRAESHEALVRAGYATLLATSANHALHLARAARVQIDIVLIDTDLEVRWQALANQLAELIPDAKVLMRSTAALDGVAFIRKPTPPSLLVAMVTAVLDGGDRFTLSSAVIAS